MRRLVDGGATRASCMAVAASFEAGLAEEAALVSVPVSAIWGDRDRMVPPSDAELLRARVPSAASISCRAAATSR